MTAFQLWTNYHSWKRFPNHNRFTGQLLFSVNYGSSAGDFDGSRSSVNEVVLWKKKRGEKEVNYFTSALRLRLEGCYRRYSEMVSSTAFSPKWECNIGLLCTSWPLPVYGLAACSEFGRKQTLESFLLCICYRQLFWTPCDRSAISPLLLSKAFIISALKNYISLANFSVIESAIKWKKNAFRLTNSSASQGAKCRYFEKCLCSLFLWNLNFFHLETVNSPRNSQKPY